ncbi:acylneuraminate cytidylyltransferase family protein [Castellaniella ginsengisoli]|uniref:Acylneuraminate cytidylyltransferase family protein n=1 Tax=Castellaniella ginsengisoli TaxID=546114 RepID=A0AB39ESY0_9BURK
MRLAVIPARGGSRRIPKKNIIPFCGRPMISYALEAVNNSGLFDKIHVSTDSEEICDVVAKLGYEIDFMRDSALADDFTGLVPVLRWVVNEYQSQGLDFQDVCCMMPNAPLIQSSDLLEAINIFDSYSGRYPLLVYARYPVPVEWAFRRDDEGIMTAISPESLLVRSQDLMHAYYECGPFSLWRAEHLQKNNPLTGKVLSYVMPNERAVDIDTPEDLAYAERLFKLMEKT